MKQWEQKPEWLGAKKTKIRGSIKQRMTIMYFASAEGIVLRPFHFITAYDP